MKILEKALGFDPKTMKLRTELIAGVTTFLTMSYILAVNPSILMTTGMSQGALFTATALASAIATLLLAFMAKLPFAQAPSMGLNAFFAYTLCQAMGYSWQNSLAILLIEGIVFILITFFNVREMIFNAIPNNLRYAISAGIGMFIAFIGLKNAGIIVAKEGTFVGLGAFTAPCLLGIFATLLSGILMARKVKGALFWGIIVATIVGIPMGVTMFPDHWLPVSAPQDISPIFCKFDFSGLLNLKTVLVVFSLLIVNIFDTIGTLMGLAEKTGIVREDGSIPRVSEAMMSDAIGTTCGAMLGSSTISTYIESASGIAEGGRSGVTSLVVGGMFFVPLSYLLAHTKCSHKWCAYHGRCAHARLCKEDKPAGYDRSFPCFHNHDNDGFMLFHCRWYLSWHSVFCHYETLYRSLERLKLDTLYSFPPLHHQLCIWITPSQHHSPTHLAPYLLAISLVICEG